MLVARSGLSPLMVGREAELAELRRLFAAVHAGETPPVAIVSGEAGVGKTRLLRELAGAVTTEGGAVLVGRADEATLAPPFEVLRDAVQSPVGAWDDLPDPLGGRAHALGHVLSPLLPDPAGHESDHEHTVEELVRAAVDLVAHVVGATPTLLAFEDLHWGDAESIALFTRLASTPGLPVLLVATFRPEDFDRRHPLARALPALERQRSVCHLQLGRLDAAGLARMLEAVFGRAVPTAAVAALQRRTQGNPFFVEELVAGCDCADPAELAVAPLPWNAAEAVLRRVDDLDDEARLILNTASLLGSRVPFDLLAAVSGAEEQTLIAALHILVDRGLLVESDVDVFGFRHALTREAVAGQLLGREQRRIHEAALAALEEQGSDDLAALAQHAAGARQWKRAVAYAREGAARHLRDGAGLQALQLSEVALGVPDGLEDADELALRETAARAAWHAAALDVAEQHAQAWRRLAAELQRPAAEAAAWRQLSLLWVDDDRYREAVDRARGIAEQVGPSEELAWCYAYTSQAHMLASEDEDAILWAERALSMADDVGTPHVRPWALVNKGTVLTERPGEEEDGYAVLEAAAEEALAHGDYTTAARALNNALAYLVHGAGNADGERARALLHRADQLADSYGMELFAANYAGFRAHVEALDGDLHAAQDALRSSRAVGDAEGVAQATTRAVLLAEQGRADEAARELDDIRASARGIFRHDPGVWWLVGRIAVAARRGDREEAAAAVGEFVTATRSTDRARIHKRALAAEAFILAARGAVPLVDLRPLLDATGPGEAPPMNRAWLDHADGILAESAGDLAAAAGAYRAALDSPDGRRPAWAVADVEQGLARCLAALGDRAAAREHAQRAVALLARWPGWRRDEAQALLRRLAGGGADAPAGLTPREREVLRLIAEGCSNREIGERLYIATKTVAVHVSNILAKTGCSSRGEAAAWARRAGVLEETADRA